jgi:hypothetical protein
MYYVYAGVLPPLRSLDTEFKTIPLSKARQGLGLPPEWIAKLERAGGDKRHVLAIRRCMPRSHAHNVLKEGDLLLAVNGRVVVSYRDVEEAVQYSVATPATVQQEVDGADGIIIATDPGESLSPSKRPTDRREQMGNDMSVDSSMSHMYIGSAATDVSAQPHGSAIEDGSESGDSSLSRGRIGASERRWPSPSDSCDLTILREGDEMHVRVVPSLLSGRGTDRLVAWSGMLLQEAHEPVEARGFIPLPTGCPPYCSRWSYGSPAHKGGLRATNWITEVNGHPVTDMDSFLAVVSSFQDNTDVRLRCVDLQDRKRVFTLKTDLHYWPTVELRRIDGRAWSSTVPSNGVSRLPSTQAIGDTAGDTVVCDVGSEWRLIRHNART